MNLTNEFSRISITDWELPISSLNNKFSSVIESIKDGLYLMIISNPHKKDIYDNNKNKKVVIKAEGTSVKVGKFNNGIIKRRRDDFRNHLHYTDAENKHMLGSNTIDLLYIIDLSNSNFITCKTADCFEKILIQSIQKLLDTNSWDANTSKRTTEWRHIKSDVPINSLVNLLNQKIKKTEKIINNIINSYKGQL
tara:strand:- start:1598 stop:2179 length:582 start_codon:yes stop_codon:yes gene_type:complete